MPNEVGRIGQRRYGGVFYEEFVKELSGSRGVEVYREMSENDDVVGAILYAIEMLMRQCTFTVGTTGSSEADRQAADFIEECMYDMEQTWTDTISEILSFLTYGWSYHEIVYKRRSGNTQDPKTRSKYDDGLIGWRKIPIRAQETLYQWKYKDGTDDLEGMIQMPPPDFGQILIPIEKSLHFVTRSRKGNPEGRSILRSAYRDWYFKKRIQEIEGIGIERDLAGFPVLKAPEGVDLWDTQDPDMMAALMRAEGIVTSIRRDSREGLVLPPGWDLTLLSTGSRRSFDTNEIINRYDKRIATTVLADFIFLGHQAVGSFALSSDKTRLFSLAIGTYLDIICEVFNNQAIPRLIDLNKDHFSGLTTYPEMRHGDVEDANLQKIGTFIKDMVGIGALVPDEPLEDFVREIGHLPERQDGAPTIPPEKAAERAQETPNPSTGRDTADDDEKDAMEAEEAKKSLYRTY